MLKNLNLLFLFIIPQLTFCSHGQTGNNQSKKTQIDEYQLVWSDEFGYQGLPDSTKWSFDIEGNAWGWGNNELQNYTFKRKENAFADGDFLHIKAIKEKWEEKNYTSARIITKEKGDWLYGKFEIRAKLPTGKGTWPAIWMLPRDSEYGDWPKSGEIDIMEHVGYIPDSIFASAHTESYNHKIGTNKTKSISIPDCEAEFHNYVVEWNENEYHVYVDSTLYFTFKNEGTGYKEWPYNKRFYLILNLAVGGFWGGAKGVDENIFPQEMIIDYVRVFQKNNKIN